MEVHVHAGIGMLLLRQRRLRHLRLKMRIPFFDGTRTTGGQKHAKVSSHVRPVHKAGHAVKDFLLTAMADGLVSEGHVAAAEAGGSKNKGLTGGLRPLAGTEDAINHEVFHCPGCGHAVRLVGDQEDDFGGLRAGLLLLDDLLTGAHGREGGHRLCHAHSILHGCGKGRLRTLRGLWLCESGEEVSHNVRLAFDVVDSALVTPQKLLKPVEGLGLELGLGFQGLVVREDVEAAAAEEVVKGFNAEDRSLEFQVVDGISGLSILKATGGEAQGHILLVWALALEENGTEAACRELVTQGRVDI